MLGVIAGCIAPGCVAPGCVHGCIGRMPTPQRCQMVARSGCHTCFGAASPNPLKTLNTLRLQVQPHLLVHVLHGDRRVHGMGAQRNPKDTQHS